MRFQIADLQRTARQDRLETQEMLRAILDRLPPASGPSTPPALRRLHDALVIFFSHPLALHSYFLYQHTVDNVNFEFGGIYLRICAHFVFFLIMHFISIMVYFLLCA
jgi:hypothetical protein